MSEKLIFELVPVTLLLVAGLIHSLIRIAQLETKVDTLWRWWVENHNGEEQ